MVSSQPNPAHWSQSTSDSEDENPWKLALEGSGLGVWDWDLVSGKQSHSARWEEILGYGPGEVQPGYSAFFSRLHPDDVPLQQQALKDYLDGTSSTYAVDLRMRNKAGGWSWVITRGMAVKRDANGQVLRMIGTHTDLNQRMAVEAELQARSRLLRDTLGSISQGVLLLDTDKRVVSFNARACELLDLQADFLASQPTLKQINQLQMARGDFGSNAALVEAHAREYVFSDGDAPAPPRYLRVTPQGHTLEVISRMLPEGGMVRTFSDVSDYVQVQKDRAQMDLDRDWHFQGLTPTYHNEHRVRCKDGSWKWILSRGMVISRDEEGKPLRMIGTHTDITERKDAEALIRQQAFFDALTGLPNRRMLRDRLEQEIKRCKRDNQQLAVLFMDLDHFKEVNDTLGHDSGDQLLVQAAKRIKSCVRDADTVARMGGDEFTVILTDVSNTDLLEPLLQKILRSMDALFQIGDEQVFVSASIGITLYPLDATEIEDLYKNADQALYVAKGDGRNRFSFFTPALQEAAQTRVRLANDLRTALVDNQFRVLYQPIIELATGSIHKAEALIRWQHPKRGLVSPAAFIPIAESSGMIVDIGEWVFQQAAAQAQQWRQRLHPQFQISVNRSPVQFRHTDMGQAPWGMQMHAMGLPGDALVVEITEGLLLDTSAVVSEQLLALGDAGIKVSLDDFGTGYSSLAYLQKFDIDFIKIDQSFVRHLIPDSTDLALCKAIIVMAHALGIQVIAEGVETEQQRDLLIAAGCDYGQGYLFARPISAAEFETLVKMA